MPDAALMSTDRQFRELLRRAAGNQAVSLRVFSIPDVERSDASCRHVSEHHEATENLWDAELDGLIVTGTEPRAAALVDEPHWPFLARLIDWAAEHTTSTVWSCLSAHAAVYRLDRIERQRHDAKLSGVFECASVTDHTLMALGSPRWCTPHSRYNGMPEEALVAQGYRILSRAADAGADIFMKHPKSLFVFLQGHPEYDARALLREYRRDVRRYLISDRYEYPDLPIGYFSAGATEALIGFRDQAMRERDTSLLPGFELLMARQIVTDPWRPAATQLFANWLSFLAVDRPAAVGWSPAGARGHEGIAVTADG
jgi:homoserine O-succinyltransferase